MSAQLSQVVCRSGEPTDERSGYERRTRKNAIAPRATTASVAAPSRNGADPLPLDVGTGVTPTATRLGDAEAVALSVGTGVVVGLGAVVVGPAVGTSVGAVVGGAVGATVGGAVRTGGGTGVGGGVGAEVAGA